MQVESPTESFSHPNFKLENMTSPGSVQPPPVQGLNEQVIEEEEYSIPQTE
jgi:hypothetical protein